MDEQAIKNELAVIVAAVTRIKTAIGETVTPPVVPPVTPTIPSTVPESGGKIMIHDTDYVLDLSVYPWVKMELWTGIERVMVRVQQKCPRPLGASRFEAIDGCPFEGNSPPYYGCEDYYGDGLFDRGDFVKLRDILASISGKFILSINDVDHIRGLFKDFHIETVETSYSAAGAHKKKKVSELLIMNFQPS